MSARLIMITEETSLHEYEEKFTRSIKEQNDLVKRQVKFSNDLVLPRGLILEVVGESRSGKTDRAESWMSKDPENRRVVDLDREEAERLAAQGYDVVLNLIPEKIESDVRPVPLRNREQQQHDEYWGTRERNPLLEKISIDLESLTLHNTCMFSQITGVILGKPVIIAYRYGSWGFGIDHDTVASGTVPGNLTDEKAMTLVKFLIHLHFS